MIPNVWTRACNGASSCVEVALGGDLVRVRDSKDPGGPSLAFTVGSWWSYLAAVKSRQLGTWAGPVLLVRSGPGGWRMWDERDYGTGLEFTDAEVAAFLAGVDGGEFDPPVLAPGGDGPACACSHSLAGADASPVPASHLDSGGPSTAV